MIGRASRPFGLMRVEVEWNSLVRLAGAKGAYQRTSAGNASEQIDISLQQMWTVSATRGRYDMAQQPREIPR